MVAEADLKRLNALLKAHEGAAFACGEWDEDDDDSRTYDEVFEECRASRRAIERFVHNLIGMQLPTDVEDAIVGAAKSSALMESLDTDETNFGAHVKAAVDFLFPNGTRVPEGLNLGALAERVRAEVMELRGEA